MTTKFDTSLKAFIKGLTGTKDAAKACADLSLEHYVQHGDTSQIQKFYDALVEHGNNFVRVHAYLLWLREYSSVAFEGKKFSKNVEKAATRTAEEWAAALEKAKTTPFWDFAPAKEIGSFNELDLIKALYAVIRRHENEDRFKPANEQAKATLTEAKTMVAEMAKKHNVELQKAA